MKIKQTNIFISISILILFFVYFLRVSSLFNKEEYDLDKALEYAGKNKIEIQKVIRHYQKNPKDSLKLKAAKFLIYNMPYHTAAYYNNNNFKKIFSEIGKINNQNGRTFIWDSIAKNFPNFQNENIEYKNDLEVVSYKFLIDNIDNSFKAWETFPWCRNLSFEDFKKYILPYRMSNEPIENENFRLKFMEMYSWVIDSMKNETNMEKAFEFVYNDFNSKYGDAFTWKYPLLLSHNEFLSAKSGSCSDIGNTLGMILRSMGIKCAHDFVDKWGNKTTTFHSWVSFVKSDTITLFIDNDKKLMPHRYIHSGKFKLNEPGIDFIPDNIKVQEYKKGSKIRRNSFIINPNSLLLKKEYLGKIPKYWNDLLSMDVTKQYINTSDVTITPNKETPLNQLAYLAVYGLDKFHIVASSEKINGVFNFKNMGTDIIYFPMAYVNNKLELISKPFLLYKDNQIKEFKVDKNSLVSMKLNRKYPLFGNTLNYANDLLGGIFQASNDSTFKKSNTSTLFEIKKSYLCPTVIDIKNRNQYRYFRYLSSPNSSGNIAEIRVNPLKRGYLNSNSKIISNGKSLNVGCTAEKAFDNDLLSYYQSKENASWIGIDFGEKTQIDSIYFSPRSDTNFIIPDYIYELFYWDEKTWTSLGTKKAIEHELIYHNVPSNTIYWLHCLNGGNEERPFTHEQDCQIWW